MAIRFLDDQAPAPKKIGRVRFLEEGEEPPQPSLLERAQPYIDEGIQKGAEMSTAAQEKYLAPVMRPIMEAGDKVGRAMSTFQTGSPLPWEVAKKGVGAAMEGIEKAGEATSEFLGEKGVNPYLAATAGLAVQNIPSFLVPGSKAGTTGRSLLKASVPLERQAAVGAAERLGVPLTRAEQSGSRAMAGLESTLEKTPLGSGPIDEFRGMRGAKLDAAKGKIQSELGSQADVYTAGERAKEGLRGRAESMRAKKDDLFNQVPTEINVPLSKSRSVAEDIINKQKEFLPTTRNADLIRMAEDVQSASEALSSGAGVTGGFKTSGVTRKIAPTTKKVQSSLVDEAGNPLSYDKKVPGKTEYGVEYSASPEESFAAKPNYEQIKRLRETLNARIEASGANPSLPGQGSVLSGDYMALKKALDEDIDAYVASQDTPLGEMMGKEFAQSYRKANAFSGAFSKIFKGPEAKSLDALAPEKVIDSVFKRNNETAIKRFRAVAGEEGFQEAKRKFTQDLLESPNLDSELGKYSPGTLNAIFRPDELQRIKDLSSTQGLTKSVTNLQGTSGSARSNVQAASYGALGSAATLFATGHPILGTGALLGFAAPRPLAKGYLASGEGISTALGKGTVNAARRGLISAYIMKDKERRGQ